jgi:PAS domain S-box-containing protein
VGQSYRKTLLLLGTVIGALSLASVMVHRTNLSRIRAKEEVRHWQQKLQLEEQLRRAEERYRTLFEQSPDGILMLDPETLRPLEFNAAAHQQLGFSQEEFSRMNAGDHAAQGTPAETKARFTELLQSGNTHFEIEQRTKQGGLRTVEVIGQTLKLAERTVLHCIHHDITERKRAEAAVAGRSAQLEALHQASLSISAETEVGVLLQTITHQALALFRGTSAGLWLYRRGSDELEWVVGAGDVSPPVGAGLKQGQALAGRCWEKGTPLVVMDRQRWEGGPPTEGESPWTAAMAAPLRWGEAFLGVLEIHSDTAGFFTREDAALLGLFATQAAIAVKNAGLLEQVRRDESIKTTLLHDVSHRVKNNLVRLREIIRLERERVLPAAASSYAALADLEDRLRGMELVHTMLSTSQWQPLPLRELVTQIVTGALSGSPIRERICVTVLTPGEPLRVVPEQATAIALILSELVTNSAKHAFANRAEGRLDVLLRVEGETNGRPLVRLEFRDDGPGWPEDVLSGQSRHVGMHLIQASVRSPLRGELALRNDHGAVAEVAFKLALIE